MLWTPRLQKYFEHFQLSRIETVWHSSKVWCPRRTRDLETIRRRDHTVHFAANLAYICWYNVVICCNIPILAYDHPVWDNDWHTTGAQHGRYLPRKDATDEEAEEDSMKKMEKQALVATAAVWSVWQCVWCIFMHVIPWWWSSNKWYSDRWKLIF